MLRTEQLSVSPAARATLLLLALAAIAAAFGDLGVTTRTPLFELQRIAAGFMHPAWLPWPELSEALLQTLAYAITGVSIAAAAGFALALVYGHRGVRWCCAALRSVHELFWGLLFLQLIGIQPLTAMLAIALPYSGIFAKVYAEIIEEARAVKPAIIPDGSDRLSRFAYGTFAAVRTQLADYTLYRLECGIRSSTILGFIGLPTLGYHLVAAFMQGHYAIAAGLLMILYLLIAGLRLWMRWTVWPFAALAALVWIIAGTELNPGMPGQIAGDMVPAPLRDGDVAALLPWVADILRHSALPGAINTVLVSQMAVALAGFLALVMLPLVSAHFSVKPLRLAGHCLLVILRATPELIITFVLLLVWGPSMLPAVVAMGLHNGAIIANLSGRFGDATRLRIDAAKHLNRYSYELLPRIYSQFLALLFYRWEIILRETAVLGVLGIATLGFYIDSAFEAFRFDEALLLIAVAALLNISVEASARNLRHRLHLQAHPDTQAPAPAL